jgi:hypothetical protein
MPSNPSFGDFCYLSVVTLATLGYGDITPACNSPVVKALVCVEVALGLGAVMALLQPVFSEIAATAKHQNPYQEYLALDPGGCPPLCYAG